MTPIPRLLLSFLLACGLALTAIAPIPARAEEKELPVPTPEQTAALAAWLPEKPFGVGRPIGDRAAWTEAAKLPAFQKQLKEAEAFAKEPVPDLTEALFQESFATGLRDPYEALYRKRTARLTAFAVAECVENRGTYLPFVEAELQAILTERTWICGPDFVLKEHAYGGLDGAVDLGAAARVWTVATADYWLAEKLKPATRALIRSEAKRRVFDPYAAAVRAGRARWWWMAGSSNWNAVCTSGVAGAALTLVESPQERALFVQAALNSIPFYVATLGDDGYCGEGVSYWAYGFGCYLCLAEELYQQTGGKVNLYAGDKLRQAALFMNRLEIVPKVYPAFGDAQPGTTGGPPSLMWLIDRRWGMGWNVDVTQSDMFLKHPLGYRLFGFGLFGFPLPQYGGSLVAGAPAKTGEKDGDKRFFFRDESVLVCRALQPGRPPFGLALKGGKNGLPMSHDHNDNGTFVVASGESPLIVDPGMERYTRNSFGPRRFESMMMNSYGHSVPYIGKTLQKGGPEAQGKIVETTFTDARDTVKMDLTSSYDVPALVRLTRTYVFDRVRPALEVIDEAEFKAPTEYGSALVTLSEWKEEGPGAFLIYDKEKAAALRATVTVEGDGGGIENKVEPVTGFLLPPNFHPTRLGMNLARPVTRLTWRTVIVPASVPAASP